MMPTRFRPWLFGLILLIVAAASVGSVILAQRSSRQLADAPAVILPAVPPQEPVYHEKPLSYWVMKAAERDGLDYSGPPAEALDAIRAIGPQAVPFLLSWMPQPGSLHERKSGVPNGDELEIVWATLGPDGKAAIPYLVRTLNQPQRSMDDYSVWTKSATAISYLGPDAIVPMLTIVTNVHRHEVWELIDHFGNLGTNGAPAVPALLHWANDPDNFVRSGLMHALGGIAQRPDLALPVILNTVEHDSDGMVRRDAAEALGAFAEVSDAVLPELIKLLKDPNWEAREGALTGLGKCRDQAATVIPLITPFLSDENSVLERSAAYALRDLNCRSAYKALVENENHNIGDIVYQARAEEKARQKQFK